MSVASMALPIARWQPPGWAHLAVRGVSVTGILAALALAGTRGQGEAIPVALAGLALGIGGIYALFRGADRRFLLTLFLAAFALRLLAAVISNPYLISVGRTKEGVENDRCEGCLFQDDRAYTRTAWALARTWMGTIPGVASSDAYLLKTYTFAVGGLYYVFGREIMLPKFMNAFFGAAGAVAMFALGRELGGRRVGVFAAIAGAVWPSLILWSVINLKDALVVLLIATVMAVALRFGRRPSIITLVALLGTFALLEDLRLYVYYAFGWLVPISFFLGSDRPWRQRLAIGIGLWATIVALMFVMGQGTQWLGLRYLTDKRVEALDTSRRFGADTAESGIDLEAIPRSDGGWVKQLTNAPRVLPYVLFAPFPWSATSPRNAALVTETVAWVAIEVLAVVAVIGLGRSHWRTLFMPIVFWGGLVFVFSIIEGNVGTIFRHRAMLMPAGFTVGAMGLFWLVDRFGSRRPSLVTSAVR
ncbi:MAG: hypothetical protein U0821_05550 [Chloroflexota bacterium]